MVKRRGRKGGKESYEGFGVILEEEKKNKNDECRDKINRSLMKKWVKMRIEING